MVQSFELSNSQTVDNIASSDEYIDMQISTIWVLVAAILVFMMQPGFAMLEVGHVRVKAGPNVLLKNILDAATGSIIWWAVGYAFAFGESQNRVIGTSGFFTTDAPDAYDETAQYWSKWFFQWAFAATAATIVSGAVAERCQFRAYIIYTIIITGVIYPVVVHWVWSSTGWLSFQTRGVSIFPGTNGLLDFAGSGVVHMVGGGASLVGAAILGPRFGRFNREGDVIYIQGQSTALATLGTFILWVGWYGFNAGSLVVMEKGMAVAAKVVVNTTLSIGAGCISTLILNSLWGYPMHINPALNGLLGGAVAITAGCAFVEPYAAVIIGVISAAFYMGSSTVLRKLHVDDPVDAAPVHFFCGLWGLMAVGFFATHDNTEQALGYAPLDWGVFYGGSGAQLGVQFLGILVIAVWTLFLSSVMFSMLKIAGWFRMPADEEIRGLNHSMHRDIEMNLDHLQSQFRQANGGLNGPNVVATVNNYHSQLQLAQQQAERNGRTPDQQWHPQQYQKPQFYQEGLGMSLSTDGGINRRR